MTKDIENLLDSYDSEQKTRSELENTIKKLRNVINKLKNDEILNFKSIIASQKRELAQKEHEKQLFKERIDELATELEKSKDIDDLIVLGIKSDTIEKIKDEKTELQGEIDWLNEEIANLEKQISKLQVENRELLKSKETINQEILELKKEKELLSKSDEAKKHYQLDIVDLEEHILGLNEKISNLEEENKRVNKYCEKLKSDRFIIAKLEKLIIDLNEKITELEIENLNLKGIVEVTPEITQRKEKEIVSVKVKRRSFEKFPEIPKGIVARMIRERSMEKPKISTPFYDKEYGTGSALLMEKETPIESSVGRKSCPKCGNTNRRFIHEILDKTNLISVYPRIYGKKLRCGECGCEWR
ncbi:MAG: hypothetical protein ACFE8A_00675 [Candidatus Hodarchaeota archaeon]